jgi:hypothetical protein
MVSWRCGTVERPGGIACAPGPAHSSARSKSPPAPPSDAHNNKRPFLAGGSGAIPEGVHSLSAAGANLHPGSLIGFFGCSGWLDWPEVFAKNPVDHTP